MRIDGGLVCPAVDEQDGFRIVQGLKILITQVARLLPDVRGNAGLFHLFSERPGAAV